jgi:5-methyltetrahydrofolate--homocysteine methyltransferase
MNIRNKIKIVIGGAPVTEAYAVEIGADGYGVDAAEALLRIEELTHVK